MCTYNVTYNTVVHDIVYNRWRNRVSSRRSRITPEGSAMQLTYFIPPGTRRLGIVSQNKYITPLIYESSRILVRQIFEQPSSPGI